MHLACLSASAFVVYVTVGKNPRLYLLDTQIIHDGTSSLAVERKECAELHVHAKYVPGMPVKPLDDVVDNQAAKKNTAKIRWNTYIALVYKALRSAGGLRRPLRSLRKEKTHIKLCEANRGPR